MFHGKCLTGSSITTRLKLMIKTPEEHHSRCSCAFIVDLKQILDIGWMKFMFLLF